MTDAAERIRDNTLRQVAQLREWMGGEIERGVRREARSAGQSVAEKVIQKLRDTMEDLGAVERKVAYHHDCIVYAVRANDFGGASEHMRTLRGVADGVDEAYRYARDALRAARMIR